MTTDNIQIVSAEQFPHEHVTMTHTAPDSGDHCPTGCAGYVVDECSVVCHECYDSESHDNPSIILGDAEFDAYSGMCHECERLLDTYQLVYASQDPELFWQCRMAEEMPMYDELPTVEQIGEYVEREAYQLGKSEAEPMDMEPEQVRVPTDSARYANIIAPKLRALCGYSDMSGAGTYTEPPCDDAYWIFNSGAAEKYHEGYIDGVTAEQ